MTLRVLGRVSSINVRKVTWALDEIGVPYEREDWGLPVRDPQVADFLALNPNGQVPVLIDADYVLWESNAILGYLADRHERLAPGDGAERARVAQWLYWQLGELNPQWGYAVNALLRRNPAYADATRTEQSLAAWTAKLRILDDHLGEREYMVGDEFSIADIAIALSSHRWFLTPVPDRPLLASVEAHYARAKQRSAGAQWMSESTP